MGGRIDPGDGPVQVASFERRGLDYPGADFLARAEHLARRSRDDAMGALADARGGRDRATTRRNPTVDHYGAQVAGIARILARHRDDPGSLFLPVGALVMVKDGARSRRWGPPGMPWE